MEATLGLLGGGGGGGGGGAGGGSSGTSVNESVVEQEYLGLSSEASSFPSETELELGLGLSLGGGGGVCGLKSKACAWGERGRILTAKDFPSVVGSSSVSRMANRPNSSLVGAVAGTKRAADSVSRDAGSPPRSSQVVGWPPIRAYRMNSLVNQAKTSRAEEEKPVGESEKCDDVLKKKVCNGNNKNNTTVKEKGHLGFVKVNMDGIPIGRKVDLSAHSSYETLAQMLENMFFKPTATISSIGSGGEKEHPTKLSKLLDGSSEFELTYEDKEGDWMLVGDVPWGMFISTVKRLRIMRTSEANGLAPLFQERNDKQRSKPI